MGGFFGAALRCDCMADVFFGVDYHSHLGTRRAGLAAYDPEIGLQRSIHSIENAPFRTKFQNVFEEMRGTSAIGCISDSDPQPMLIRSHLGTYAICTVGGVFNADELVSDYLSQSGRHFDAMTGGRVNNTELVAALLDTRDDFCEGIRFVQEVVKGAVSLLILREDGSLLAARDRFGRLPVLLGRGEDGYCVTFESFAYQKLGYADERELGPGEVVEVRPEGVTQLVPPGKEMKLCAFLFSYYGYPTARYEGISVEAMRYRNGRIMAENDKAAGKCDGIDYIGGVPDSGTPHAIGYANESGIPFSRPFIKYTPTWPRSFMPPRQVDRERVAKMKQVPVHELIEGKSLLFVDDSIVRGTQLKETVDFLYDNGAESVHMRSASPPIMYLCKYLGFSSGRSEMDLLARRIVYELEGEEGASHLDEYADGATERGRRLRAAICEKLHFASLEFQTVEGVVKAIGLPAEKLCTYCWCGKE